MTKFNEESKRTILLMYENGVPLKYCAYAVGISKSTLFRWIDRGKKEEAGEYHDFYLNVMKARSKFVLHHQKKINDNSDWRSSQYLLQVTDPNHYVLQDKLKVESKQDVNMKLFDKELFNKLIDEENERRKRLSDDAK